DDEASFILEREPDNASAYEVRGAAMLARQQLEKALQAYGRLAELRPQDPTPFTDLALVESNLKRFPEAEQHLRKAIELAPLAVPSYINLANFYRLRQQLPEAEQVLKDGVKRNPDAAPLYINWADLLYAQHKAEGATGVLTKLRERKRNSAEIAIAIGDFYFQRGETEPALRSEEHTSELQSRENLVCRLLLEKKKKTKKYSYTEYAIY